MPFGNARENGLPLSGGTVAGDVEADSYVANDAVATTPSGDRVSLDNNGLSGGQRTTDTAPQGLLVRPQSVFGDGSQTSARLVLAGGQDETYISIDSYALGQVGDTVGVVVFNSNGARVTNTFTVVASGPGANQFVAQTSNIVTASNLAAAINTAAIGVTATASVGFPGSILLSPGSATSSITLTSSRPTFASVASGNQGVITLDGSTAGIEYTVNGAAANTWAIVPRGTAGTLGVVLNSTSTTLGTMQAAFASPATLGGSVVAAMDAASGLTYGPGPGTGMLTAGTMTGNTTQYLRTGWTKFAWTNAMVVALGATTTGNISVCTLPAKTIVKRCIVIITGAAAGPASVSVSVGRTGAAYIDFVVASDAKAAANTVYGDAQAEIGAGLVGGIDDMPSYTGTTVVNAQFVSVGANLSTVTGSTGIVYLQTELLP